MEVTRRGALFGAFTFAAGGAAGVAALKIKREASGTGPGSSYLNKRQILAMYPPHGDIAIVGDSIVERGPWLALLGPHVGNYGIGGEMAAWASDRVAAISAAKVVLWLGINDLIAGRTVASVASDILFAAERSPAPCWVCSIGPTGENRGDLSERAAAVNDRVRQGTPNFIDLWPVLEFGGYLKGRASHDGLHLRPSAYREVADVIVSNVGEAVGAY